MHGPYMPGTPMHQQQQHASSYQYPAGMPHASGAFYAPSPGGGPLGYSSASVAFGTQSVAGFGRLCRELAAVRARARPLLWEAFAATARAKTQAADPYYSGGPIVPVARDVEAWLLGCLRRTAEQEGDHLHQRYKDLLSTATVRSGLAAAGYAASKDALAVLRSAFRVRAEHGASVAALHAFPQANPHEVRRYLAEEGAHHHGHSSDAAGKEHAAVLVAPLAFLLTADEPAAASMLAAMDEQAQRRTGHARPPTMGGGVPGMLDMSLSNIAYGAHPQVVATTPMRGGGALSAAGFGSPPPQHATFQQQQQQQQQAAALLSSSIAMGGMPNYGSSVLGGFAPSQGGMFATHASAAPVARSVGDFLRTHATGSERDNLVSLLSTVVDFEQRLGIPQPHGASAAGVGAGGTALGEGADSCVIALGPRLRVGLRFYVTS